MRTVLKGLGVALSIFLYFCLLSRIDFIVHGDLYHYGLQFSCEWANEYWITYFVAYAYFSIVIGFMYWLASNRTRKDLKVSLGLIATVNLLLIGGLADIIFFGLWAGGLPPDSIVWWWVPWYQIFGVWTSSIQIVLMVFMSLVVVFMWIKILSFSDFFVEQTFIKNVEKSLRETIDA
ncbi:MAG: hypothetical protein ACE5J6_00095 [Candidatus Bathyarchaeia archaeon]